MEICKVEHMKHMKKRLSSPCFYFHTYTIICTPKVIDPCNLLLHQVVLSFCYLVAVFCFILGSRMSLL